jgi:hypothetical protein
MSLNFFVVPSVFDQDGGAFTGLFEKNCSDANCSNPVDMTAAEFKADCCPHGVNSDQRSCVNVTWSRTVVRHVRATQCSSHE